MYLCCALDFDHHTQILVLSYPHRQHIMKLSTTRGLVKYKEPSSGKNKYAGTVIEYTAPTITAAAKTDHSGVADKVGQAAKTHYAGHTGVRDNHIAADNENRTTAVSDAIEKEYVDSDVMTKT